MALDNKAQPKTIRVQEKRSDTMAASGLDYVTLDVFTEKRFGGNPLGLVLVPEGKSPSQEEKQLVAREFNYSETVFLHLSSRSEQTGEWRYDIFTTESELPFAGHPTIGTAWYIAKLHPHLSKARLLAKAGPVELTFEKRPGTDLVYASAEIPHNVHVHTGQGARLQLDDLLKMQPGLAEFRDELDPKGSAVVSIVKGMTFACVEVKSMEALRAIRLCPQPTADFIELDDDWKESFTASYFYYVDESKSSGSSLKLNCRMIESAFGEDPATGSGSAALCAFLSIERSKTASEGSTFKFDIDQGVELGRPSKISVEVRLNKEGRIEGITQAGSAVHIMSGRLE